MKYINRRDVLKGLGVVSAAGLTSQLACDAKQGPRKSESPVSQKPSATRGEQLNIVLHGTYAILLEQGKTITLQAPYVADHIYFAATADLDKTAATPEVIWRHINWILANSPFAVNITGSLGSYPKPDPFNLPTDRVMIDWGRSKIRGSSKKPYHSLSLPWPDGISALRADKNKRNTLGGQTYTDNNLNLTQLPTVYVLKYDLPAGSAPTFTDNLGNNQKIPLGTDGVMRLHLFAEPRNGGNPMYPNMALDALCNMFKPKLRLKLSVPSYAATPIDDPNEMPIGVDRCEERSIGELGIPCSQVADVLSEQAMEKNLGDAAGVKKSWLFGGHPRNCMAVLIVKS